MSETPKRKRLTDEEFTAERRVLAPAQEIGAMEPVFRVFLADHLQAREDRKRLAERLRERLGGMCCERARQQCEDCTADEAFLAEVFS